MCNLKNSEKILVKQVCLSCISDKHLRNIIRKIAKKVKCSYCDKNDGLGVAIDDLANAVDSYLRKYLRVGGDTPRLRDDSDSFDYEQEGETLEQLLQEELGIDYDPVKDLIQVLKKEYNDFDDSFYYDDCNYVRLNFYHSEHHYEWLRFEKSIKFEKRFFNKEARTGLEIIFGKPGSSMAKELPVFILEPSKVDSIFRARIANAFDEAKNFFLNPDKELIPPDPAHTRAARMNPAGIPVFYGSLSEDVAVAEVRPSVGSKIALCEFKVTKPLKLLNLPKISACYTGSIFALDYETRCSRRRFFQNFHKLISKPITPAEETIEYLPTQVVAEYVCSVLGFDGILYGSPQISDMSDECCDDEDYIIDRDMNFP
jgi:hypothetical protein